APGPGRVAARAARGGAAAPARRIEHGRDRRVDGGEPGNGEIAAALCPGQVAHEAVAMSRHEPLTPEERELAQHLAHPGHAGPSPATDARILAAARLAAASDADAGPRASAATPPQAALSPATTTRHRRRRHWPASLGLAASVALAVGVVWQLRESPQPLATTDAVMAPSP